MHIFIITQYYPPETGAAASRWGDYTDELIKLGHNITVLCQSPNYPKGRYFPGYKLSWIKKEIISPNLTIIRSANIANERKSFFQKIIYYLVFMFSGIINSFKVKNYDFAIVSSPPLFTGLIGVTLKKIKSVDYWLDLRDIWPESAYQIGQIKKSFFYFFGKKIESLIYTNAKGFIFPVPSFEKYLINYPQNINKPMISLFNGVSDKFINKANSIKINEENIFTVLYSGNLGYAQDLRTVIDSANDLRDHKIIFKFIGNGVNKKKLESYAINNNNIFFQDSIDRDELIVEIRNASVCLVPLINSPLFNRALPSKMFEYMACSKPIIVGIKGDAKSLVDLSKSGITIEPENSSMLSSAILNYFNNPAKAKKDGANGRKYIEANLIKKDIINSFIKKINSCN